jgi:putative phosphonate metabolism protein
MTDAARYAVYFAPDPDSPLARYGAAWLGYDAATGTNVPQPALSAITSERLQEITAEPRRYGFHATLKPPFVLADGVDKAELDAAVSALAGRLTAFAAPRLRLAQVSGFWALIPSAPCEPLDNLAASCVPELDQFRAPPSATELARRRRAGLSPAQEALLLRWGYPYVMAEFRFHMTLTARLSGAEGDAVGAALAPLVEPFCQAPLPIDALSLFRQDAADRPFRLIRRYALAG